MRVQSLALRQFRQFHAAEWRLHPRLNVVRGANAAGKTTLLEAFYLATRAESFRARRLGEMIEDALDSARVVLAAQTDHHSPATIFTATITPQAVEVRRGPDAATRVELARQLPTVLVDRQLHKVFEDGPIYRRRYLDWGLFYVEPSFIDSWRRYERALRQRNSLLRRRAPRQEIEAWTSELVSAGTSLNELRRAHLAVLRQSIEPWTQQLLPDAHIEIGLSAGWDSDQSLAEALASHFESDLSAGFTHAGPHRAELRVQWGGRLARVRSSRGQQKLLAVAMALGQASLVHTLTGMTPVLLLDDLEAELAREWQSRLLAALLAYPGQTVVSSLEWDSALLPPACSQNDYAVFHVEHGAVTPEQVS